MITFITHLRVQAEKNSELETLLRHVADMTQQHEPDVLYYAFAKAVDQPDTYVVLEVYRDPHAHSSHMQRDWVKSSLPKALELIDGKPDVKQYVTPGSEPAQRQPQF